MKTLKALSLSVAIVTPGFAYSSEVITGEHDNFTRVFIPDVDKEKLSVSGNGTSIKIETGRDTTASINSFWDRITREKIADASSEPGTLEMRLNCDCKAYYTTYGNGLFIDIYGSTFNVNEDQYQNKIVTSENAQEQHVEIKPESRTTTTIQLSENANYDHFFVPYTSAFIKNFNIEEIALSHDNGRKSSASCPSDHFFDSFLQHEGIDAKKSNRRYGNLSSAFSMNEYHLETAQSYLSNGMATEALAHLRTTTIQNETSKNLALIAHIVDKSQEVDLSSWRNCGPAAQFWNALAAHEIGEFSNLEINQVFSYYYSMPAPLRDVLEERWISILSEGTTSIDLGVFSETHGSSISDEMYRIDHSEMLNLMEDPDERNEYGVDNLAELSEKFIYFSENEAVIFQLVNARVNMYIENEELDRAYEDIIKYPSLPGKEEYIIRLLDHAIKNENHDLAIRMQYEIEIPKLSRDMDTKLKNILDEYGLLTRAEKPEIDPVHENTQIHNSAVEQDIAINVSNALRAIEDATEIEKLIRNDLERQNSL